MSGSFISFQHIAAAARERQLRDEDTESIRQLEIKVGVGQPRERDNSSDEESSVDEHECNDECSDSDDSYQHQAMPCQHKTSFLGTFTQNQEPPNNHEGSGRNINPPTNPPSSNSPPSPWKKSKSKQRIIDELKDETSDIHLLIGRFSSDDFSNVNFKQILMKYASNKYKMSNFRENLKRLLINHLDKKGPFKVDGAEVEKWYTSPTNVSRGYSLLFMLYMDATKADVINSMPVKDIWESHPQFQLYDFEKFKTYNNNMKKLTTKRRGLVNEEEKSFERDMLKMEHLKSNTTSRGVPFWHTHAASKLLKDDIANEMSGVTNRVKPMQLWKARPEYQQFPLCIFRKHIYQERTKQLAAPYWQHKRNKNAQKRHEETEALLEEWTQVQANRFTEGLVEDWEKMNLDHN